MLSWFWFVTESLAGISQQSTSQPQMASANPLDWTTQEVIQYVRTKDPSLSKHAHLIQSHVRCHCPV